MSELLATFSDWTPWSDRKKVALSKPGVYLLVKHPADKRPTLNVPLVYIGETCEQSLWKRLDQFNRSAFLGKRAHSGGATFRQKYDPEPSDQWLFVSAMAVDLEKTKASAYIRYLERALIWEHVSRHGYYPSCNRK
jgi:hypothetical protein